MDNQKVCFAFNIKKRKCRCLKSTYCKNGLGENCKFYKPRSDELNNQKMREFLHSSSMSYKKGKSRDKLKSDVVRAVRDIAVGINTMDILIDDMTGIKLD